MSWIILEKTKPKDGEYAIIFADSAFVLFAQYRKGVFYDVVQDADGSYFETVTRDVTHWMPLPPPPKDES